MDLNFKNYKINKTKNFIKNNKFFFFFHSAKLNSKEWLVVEQELKILKLNYYKIYNSATLKIFHNSIYKNFNNIICGIILIIKPNFKSSLINLNLLEKKKLKEIFLLLSIKLNNKIYLSSQLNELNIFSYKQNLFYLYKTLEKHSKITYILTK